VTAVGGEPSEGAATLAPSAAPGDAPGDVPGDGALYDEDYYRTYEGGSYDRGGHWTRCWLFSADGNGPDGNNPPDAPEGTQP